MLIELRGKSQVTIPKAYIDKLGVSQGDYFEATIQSGSLVLTPVAVYPKKYLEELKEEIDQTKESIQTGKQPVFDDIDKLFGHLGV